MNKRDPRQVFEYAGFNKGRGRFGGHGVANGERSNPFTAAVQVFEAGKLYACWIDQGLTKGHGKGFVGETGGLVHHHGGGTAAYSIPLLKGGAVNQSFLNRGFLGLHHRCDDGKQQAC